MNKKYQDYTILHHEYWTNELSTKEIADKYGVKKATIQYWLNKHNIIKRTHSESRNLSVQKYPQERERHKVTVHCAWCWNAKQVWPYYARRNKYFYCSKECKAKHWSLIYTGKNAHNWKGGQWKKNSDMREWSCYQKVRNEVRERDNWTCQLCGAKSNIIAHHIIPVRKNNKLIFEPTNLISLCDKCHIEKVNFHEEEYQQLFTDIVAKTVNCWNSLRASIPQQSQ
jgi:5-methylcytosine-specific restriction endonuclease McrA